MKRILLIVSILIGSAIAALAQYPYFMGISFDKPASTIANQFCSRYNLRITNTQQSVITLSGSFLGYNDCEIFVFNNDEINLCHGISVYFPEQNTWNALKKRYREVVRNLKSQEPTFTVTKEETVFTAPYAEGDGDEMLALTNDMCTYRTIFSQGDDDAMIVVRISQDKQVVIHYYNEANVPNNPGSSSSSSSTSSSQDDNCMHFLSIPMNISASDFSQRLVSSRGFRKFDYDSESHCYSHRGRFSGHDNVEVYVFGTAISEHVFEINVYLPEQSTWAGIKAEYIAYRDALKQKYTLTNETTGFTGGHNEGSGNEVQWVTDGDCNYVAEFSAPGGKVKLTISKWMQLRIIYKDNVGVDIYQGRRDDVVGASSSFNSSDI